MKKYFISFVIKFATEPFFGNYILTIHNKSNINEIEKEIAERSLNLIKKKNEYLKNPTHTKYKQ